MREETAGGVEVGEWDRPFDTEIDIDVRGDVDAVAWRIASRPGDLEAAESFQFSQQMGSFVSLIC